jgi:hypothetical protein
MTMAWVRKVNRHVVVNVVKTVGGNTAYVKRRPAIITALGAGNLITCKVTGAETYTNVDLRTDPNENLVASKYVSY